MAPWDFESARVYVPFHVILLIWLIATHAGTFYLCDRRFPRINVTPTPTPTKKGVHSNHSYASCRVKKAILRNTVYVVVFGLVYDYLLK